MVYIGKSKKMLGRVYAHASKADKPSWHPVKTIAFDEVRVRACRPDQVDALEKQMIELYKPRMNIQLKTATKVPLASALPNLVGSAIKPLPPGPPFERRV